MVCSQIVLLRCLHAYIDESGQRARTPNSSDHFVMTAVVFAEEYSDDAAKLLNRLRLDLGRRHGDHLSWKNLKSHQERLHAAKTLGEQDWLTISSVVVCKRHLTGNALHEDHAYLYTLRFLLERLSWLARDQRRVLDYTLAHIVRFTLAKLRAYEAKLRLLDGCEIAWGHLDDHGGRINQPQRLEQLQLADLAASATAAAFEPDRFGNVEPRYLQEFSQRLYRRGSAPLTSYGLKFHPFTEKVKAAYPWVAAL